MKNKMTYYGVRYPSDKEGKKVFGKQMKILWDIDSAMEKIEKMLDAARKRKQVK